MSPQTEVEGTTHTYVARAWYRDTATWVMLGSFVWFVIQDQSNVELFIPHRYHELIAKAVLLVSLYLRFQSSTRPVAMSQGSVREVKSISPKESSAPSAGSVSNATRIGLVLLLAVALDGCAKPPPNLTPQATAAFHATRVVKALDLVMDAAIAGEAQTPKVVSTANARAVVEFHQMAVRTIHAVPDGWKPTVLAALRQLPAQLGGDYPKLAPYLNLITTLIGEIP